MAMTEMNYGESGGGEKPTLLWSNPSGATSASYDATGYSRLIVVAFKSNTSNAPRMTIVQCPETNAISFAFELSTGSTNYNTATVSASGISFVYNEGSAIKLYAVYGIKTESFDVSDIISTWNC